ncbi:MAG: hypothetical protein U0169_01150 [Polyangiaceae bacterium]
MGPRGIPFGRRSFLACLSVAASMAITRSAWAEDEDEPSGVRGNDGTTDTTGEPNAPPSHDDVVVEEPGSAGGTTGGSDALVVPEPNEPGSPPPPPRVVRTPLTASRVRGVSHDEKGTTLTLELVRAPFPAPGSGHDDPTVVVFVPAYYRLAKSGRSDVVVHFHGHRTTAERSMRAHDLREQLFDSKQNALLVMPQGPWMTADSGIGKLEAPNGFARFLADVMATLQAKECKAALARAGTKVGKSVGTVCLSAHSGGYHAAASCVKHGGVAVREVWLFDALYGDEDVFRAWLVDGKAKHERRKLVSFATGGTTAALSNKLHAALEKAGLRCARERTEGATSRATFTTSDAVFVHTAVGHTDVPNQSNGLRDCLYASGLTRHLRTSWFDKKSGSRTIDRRR